MKRLIITLLMFLPLLTGCSNIDANIDFLDSKNVLFSATVNSKDKLPPQEIELIKYNYKKFIDEDFITDVYFSDLSAKIDAVKLTKNILRNDIDLSATGIKTKSKSGRFIDVKHNIFVTLYSVDLVYDLDSQIDRVINKSADKESDKSALKPEYLQKYGDEEITIDNPEKNEEDDFKANFDNVIEAANENLDDDKNEVSEKDMFDPSKLKFQISVTLPSRASYNNADRVIDNIYFWDVKSGEQTSVKLQYIVYNSWAIFLLILVVFGLLYLLARRILKHDAQKRIGNDN